MPSWQGETDLKEWFRMKRIREKEIDDAVRTMQFSQCRHCGRIYSWGYFPVEEDPGACQRCRDAEGTVI